MNREFDLPSNRSRRALALVAAAALLLTMALGHPPVTRAVAALASDAFGRTVVGRLGQPRQRPGLAYHQRQRRRHRCQRQRWQDDAHDHRRAEGAGAHLHRRGRGHLGQVPRRDRRPTMGPPPSPSSSSTRATTRSRTSAATSASCSPSPTDRLRPCSASIARRSPSRGHRPGDAADHEQRPHRRVDAEVRDGRRRGPRQGVAGLAESEPSSWQIDITDTQVNGVGQDNQFVVGSFTNDVAPAMVIDVDDVVVTAATAPPAGATYRAADPRPPARHAGRQRPERHVQRRRRRAPSRSPGGVACRPTRPRSPAT